MTRALEVVVRKSTLGSTVPSSERDGGKDFPLSADTGSSSSSTAASPASDASSRRRSPRKATFGEDRKTRAA